MDHPKWKRDQGWEPIVTSTVVESNGETLVLDPLAPPESETDVWERLDASPPTAIVVLKPDHVRDVDLFVHRYKVRAFGPRLFFRDDIPETKLEPIQPGSQLPGGIVALYDGRGREETPLWLPELRELLKLPFEHVIVSHGEPVHTRIEYELALKIPPYRGK